MPELNALSAELVSQAQELPTRIQTSKNTARDLIGALNETLDEALKTATALSSRAQEVAQVDTLPLEYTGLIHNYRFGMVGGNPMHRFDIEIKGTGLWLACTFTSGEFDSLLMTANPAIDLFEPEVIDGKVVTVRRDPKLGRLIPVTFGLNTNVVTGPVLLKDKEGRDVRQGDVVSIREGSNSFNRTFKATVLSYAPTSDKITVQPKKTKSPKVFTVKNLFKFKVLTDEVSSVGANLIPLGKDREGKEIFVDDIVRLYDQFEDGRVAGRVLGSKAGTNVLKVQRGDGQNTEEGWAVTPGSVVKIERISLVNDSAGTLLFAGDRVRTQVSGSIPDGAGYLIRRQTNNSSAAVEVSSGDETPVAAIVRDDAVVGGDPSDTGVQLVYFEKLIKE